MTASTLPPANDEHIVYPYRDFSERSDIGYLVNTGVKAPNIRLLLEI